MCEWVEWGQFNCVPKSRTFLQPALDHPQPLLVQVSNGARSHFLGELPAQFTVRPDARSQRHDPRIVPIDNVRLARHHPLTLTVQAQGGAFAGGDFDSIVREVGRGVRDAANERAAIADHDHHRTRARLRAFFPTFDLFRFPEVVIANDQPRARVGFRHATPTAAFRWTSGGYSRPTRSQPSIPRPAGSCGRIAASDALPSASSP